MKLLITLALLASSFGVYAACTTHTIYTADKITMCTTCCANGNCTTTCI